MIQFILTFLCAGLLALSNAHARNITMILANPPGSTSDILARSFVEVYHKITGNVITLDHRPGGNHMVAAAAFRNSGPDTILFGTSTIHVYNPILEKNLPYNDNDFRHVAVVAYGPAFYITKSDSGLRTPEDLVNKLPQSAQPFVGGYAMAYNLSVDILNKRTNAANRLQVINYKGGPAVTTDVIGKHVPVGLLSATANTFQMVKEGHLHIIGSTHHSDISYEGIRIPSVSKVLGVPQTSGAYYVSVKPDVDPMFLADFQKNAKLVLESDAMKSTIEKAVTLKSDLFGHNAVVKDIQRFRETVKQISN